MLAGALLLDLLAGEYPSRWHPVVWMGVLTDRLIDFAPKDSQGEQFVYGVLVVGVVVGVFTFGTWFIVDIIRQYNPGFAVVAGALLLKPTFSIRGLWRAARGVQGALAAGEIEEARVAVSHLVSRDVAVLGQRQIASAAVESVAENFTDSVVAPLLWFVAFGPAGAMGYRAANTLDAMIGYHGRFEFLGKFAARLDDVLNLIPARIAALVLLLATPLSGANLRMAWLTLWRDHAHTASPNAGWTMSALAGALGVRLEKSGHYTLGSGFAIAAGSDIGRSLRLYWNATSILVALCFVLLAVLHAG
ncbi:MAG: cobalamin biosynthesis protein CobD [Dehalococcoidia bacterium]|nr:cobalamin biosynthesis protein CobD [Dehalococcoidia bacterium]